MLMAFDYHAQRAYSLPHEHRRHTMTDNLTPTERRTFTVTEYTSANIWQDWFPE